MSAPSPLESPLILLSSPRSGSTLLFNALSRSPGLWSLRSESHRILEGPFHPSERGWESNALGAEDLDEETARGLRAEFARGAKPGAGGGGGLLAFLHRATWKARRRFAPSSLRLVEKTPRSCLRIPFLLRLFPGARFLFLRRDGRATVSSIMEGWKTPGRHEYVTPPVPLRIGGYAGERWCYFLPPGWRGLVDRPLEEVCAAQWLACMEGVEAHLPRLRSEGRVHELSYEELVARPEPVLRAACAFAGVPFEAGMAGKDGVLPLATVVTPPEEGKWRRLHGEEIRRVLPLLAPAQERLGYPAGWEAQGST